MDEMIYLLSIPIAGLLWAYGGAKGTSKAWRRVGVALLVTLISYLKLRDYWSLILFPICFGVYTLSYGTEGEIWQDIAQRFKCSLCYSLALLPIAIIRRIWMAWIGSLAIITITTVAFGALIIGEGTYKLFGKELLWEETIIGVGIIFGTLIALFL